MLLFHQIIFRFSERTFEKENKILIIAIDDKIRDEILQYDINREAAKLSALSSSEIDKYEYLTVEEILPSNQRRVIEQAKFTYSPLGKALEKQTKIIEDQGKKQTKAIEDHGKQLFKSNELMKKNFNINRDSIPLEEQKKDLMNLLKKALLNLKI